jgi:hypothetical protein
MLIIVRISLNNTYEGQLRKKKGNNNGGTKYNWEVKWGQLLRNKINNYGHTKGTTSLKIGMNDIGNWEEATREAQCNNSSSTIATTNELQRINFKGTNVITTVTQNGQQEGTTKYFLWKHSKKKSYGITEGKSVQVQGNRRINYRITEGKATGWSEWTNTEAKRWQLGRIERTVAFWLVKNVLKQSCLQKV